LSELASSVSAYTAVEGEAPDLLARNLSSAGHLLASATAFFFLAFVFAYFYLRSLNNGGLWHPKHVDPSLTLGTLVTAGCVASAVLVRLGLADHRAARPAAWRRKGALALALGVAAIVLQVVEWTTIGFGPADGGYASVFIGWTSFYVLFVVFTLFWLETLLATAIRFPNGAHGGPAPGEASGDPYREAHDIADPLSLVSPGLEALSFFWGFLAGLGVVAWVVLYLI
jgi:heme/copper-type cytochrome/quinol oxidase subunit 3